MTGEKLRTRETTKTALVHFTGSRETSFAEIKREHLARGMPEIGFHFIIEEDGKLLKGRDQNKVGAHSPEFDETSVGICVVGGKGDMSFDQKIALDLLLAKIKEDHPEMESVKYVYRMA